MNVRNLSNLGKKGWVTLIVLIGTIVGLIFAGLSLVLWPGELGLDGRILILIAGFGSSCFLLVCLALILKGFQQLETEFRKLERRIGEGKGQQMALTNVRPLLGSLPVSFRGWAVDPLFAEEIVRTLMEKQPRLVVECGPGSSTVVIAACLRHLGQGRVIALEHDRRFREWVEKLLTLHGLDDLVRVIEAPLLDREIDGAVFKWYSCAFAEDINEEIEVLVVDGPPGPTGPLARYPAVPLLHKALSPDCAILLDDGNRPDEQWIAKKWAEELGASAEYRSLGKGSWIIRPPWSTPPDTQGHI